MTERVNHPPRPLIEGASAWIGADLRGQPETWTYTLSAAEISEIEAATAGVLATGGDIAGITRAEGVGLVLLAGLGGIHAEALKDVTMWPIPADRASVEAGLRTSALGRVLTGPRWKHPDAFGRFIDTLMALQTAAVSLGDGLKAIDVNPVILGAGGAVAVDALVIPAS